MMVHGKQINNNRNIHLLALSLEVFLNIQSRLANHSSAALLECAMISVSENITVEPRFANYDLQIHIEFQLI